MPSQLSQLSQPPPAEETDKDRIRREAEEFQASYGMPSPGEEEGLEEGDLSDYVPILPGGGVAKMGVAAASRIARRSGLSVAEQQAQRAASRAARMAAKEADLIKKGVPASQASYYAEQATRQANEKAAEAAHQATQKWRAPSKLGGGKVNSLAGDGKPSLLRRIARKFYEGADLETTGDEEQ